MYHVISAGTRTDGTCQTAPGQRQHQTSDRGDGVRLSTVPTIKSASFGFVLCTSVLCSGLSDAL